MRTIHIEQRQRGTWAAVLAGLLVVALIAWWLWPDDRRASATDFGDVAGTPPVTSAAASPAAVGEFLQFADRNRAADAMGPDHDYTAEGVTRLATALAAVARQNGSAGADVEREANLLRDRADALQRDPSSTEHARIAREAFVSLAGLMVALQQGQPALVTGADEVRRAAEAIQPDRRLLDQRAEVQTFFDRAASALRGASSTR